MTSKQQPVYHTLVVQRICQTAKIPKSIGSKINEYLEMIECKYINNTPLFMDDLLSKKFNLLKFSFPSTQDQLFDLADRLNINLVLESGLKGVTCLFQSKYITQRWFNDSYCTLLKLLIESPYLTSVSVLTVLNNQIIGSKINISIESLINKIGTIKAYKWLIKHYQYDIHSAYKKPENRYYFYFLVSILNTGSLEDLIFFDLHIQRISSNASHGLLFSLLEHNKWPEPAWSSIRRVPMIMWLLKNLYIFSKITIYQFVDTLNTILTYFISLYQFPNNEYKEDVIIAFFISLKNCSYFKIEEQPMILITMDKIRTPFFIRFWWFEHYQIPLPDPFNEIQANNLSYAYSYFQEYCIDEMSQMNYSNQYKSKITKDIIHKCLSSPHVTIKELDWFLEFFQLQSLLSTIDAFGVICSKYFQSHEYGEIIFRERYKWLIQNGAYKSNSLSKIFATTTDTDDELNSFLTSRNERLFLNLLQLGGFTLNQDLVDDVGSLSNDNRINYKLLSMVLTIFNKINLKVQFPKTFCFTTMVKNYDFEKFKHCMFFTDLGRLLNKNETMVFITLKNAFHEMKMIDLIDYNMLVECLQESNYCINSLQYDYNQFMRECQFKNPYKKIKYK